MVNINPVKVTSDTISASNSATIVAGKGEAEIILPPPSEKNPIPSLSAALRVDNYEQVVQLLSLQRPQIETTIATTTKSLNNTSAATTTSNRQFLMFGSTSLRTLILRHVLADPHTKQSTSTTSSKPPTNIGQQRWENSNTFLNLPRNLNINGTAILEKSSVADTTTIIPTNIDIITYFLRPTDLTQTQNVCDFILQYQRSNRQRANISSSSTATTSGKQSYTQPHHRIVYIPQIPAMVHKLLSNVGLIGPNNTNNANLVTIHSLSLDLFPIEPDVLSMEFPDTFRELHLEGTPSTIITYIARSLLKLQDIVGTVPRIQSYGVASEQVVRKTLDIAVEEYCAQPSTSNTTNNDNENDIVPTSESVAAIVVFDRKIDMVSPLVTPLTYEGLLDDVVGIENGYINVNIDIVNPPDDETTDDDKDRLKKKVITSTPDKMVTLAMNDSDTMFVDIRDQHVEQFGTYLQQQAKSMQATQNDFKATGKQKELSELHQFVKQLPHLKQKFQFLSTHIHLAELIKYTTEQAIG